MEFDQNVIDIGYQPPVKRKILVVDDEVSLQTLIFDTLESEYRIITAYNGREGVEKAINVKPDVILMDVMMPDIGGYDAVRMLNTNEETRDIPVVVMTAQDFDTSTIQLIRQEPNVLSFLTKPFRPKSLREIIKLVLEKKGKPAS